LFENIAGLEDALVDHEISHITQFIVVYGKKFKEKVSSEAHNTFSINNTWVDGTCDMFLNEELRNLMKEE